MARRSRVRSSGFRADLAAYLTGVFDPGGLGRAGPHLRADHDFADLLAAVLPGKA